MMQQPARNVFVLGRGRSGTTWIGRVLNMNPDYVYKYEPFDPRKNSPYWEWLSSLHRSSASDAALRAAFDKIVRTCQHDIDYPPFLEKRGRPQSPLLLRAAWQLGKVVPALDKIYEWYGRPRFDGDPSILLKQVNFPNELLPDVTRLLAPQVVGVIRNPWSSVSSALRFYRDRAENPQSPEAIARVREVLALPGYESMRRYAETLPSMTAAAFETLRWRIQTEPLVSFLQTYHSAHVVIYEHLAKAPLEEFEKIYSFLGWRYDDNVKTFISSTTAAKANVRASRREFSVYRDPAESLTKWQQQLSDAEQAEVFSIFHDSPLTGLWPEVEMGFLS